MTVKHSVEEEVQTHKHRHEDKKLSDVDLSVKGEHLEAAARGNTSVGLYSSRFLYYFQFLLSELTETFCG